MYIVNSQSKAINSVGGEFYVSVCVYAMLCVHNMKRTNNRIKKYNTQPFSSLHKLHYTVYINKSISFIHLLNCSLISDLSNMSACHFL